MHSSAYIRIIFQLFLLVLLRFCHSHLNYTDLEALGITCPELVSCVGYVQNFEVKNCKCDSACKYYGDCCFDALPKRFWSVPTMRSDFTCLNYEDYTGIYVVNRCNSGWMGSREVQAKCEGDPDLSDPLFAAPVTSITQSVTYKNVYCAECNYASKPSLKMFLIRLFCDTFKNISEEQVMNGLFYDQQLASWGFNRLDAKGNESFQQCGIMFDVPHYINSSVRYCPGDVISNCSRGWTRLAMDRICKAYMALVYVDNKVYRNPHCALCNYKTLDEISCWRPPFLAKRWFLYTLFLDVNQSDGYRIGMANMPIPQCPSGYKYDPFFKRCRTFTCSLPRPEVVNSTCVLGSF